MGHEATSMIRHLFLLLALSCVLFFFRLEDRDLVSSHEARAAQNAQNMIATGDWFIPRQFNNRLDLQKPPLFYWLVALAGWMNGGIVDPWIVRLPAALSAVGCLLTLLFLGWRLGRARVGFLSALILATSLHFTWLARVGRIDMPFTFALTVSVAASLIARHQRGLGGREWSWRLLAYLAVAAAAMLKGPLAIVLSLLWHACEWWVFDRSPASDSARPRSAWHGWWGYPLVLALVAPWFLWVNWKTDNRLWQVFFWHHNLERGLGTSGDLTSYPFWYYLPRLSLDLLPWSLVLPWAVSRHWRTERTTRDPLATIGILWFGCFLLFFSCMSFKRADYLLPLFPAAALFLGAFLDRLPTRGSWPALANRQQANLCVTAILVCVGWCAYLQWLDPAVQEGWIWQRRGRQVRESEGMPVIFFRTEAHALAFHVGGPMDTILEWENLDIWATRPFGVAFVMPPECADCWREHLKQGHLWEVARLPDPDRPLVVLRNVPPGRDGVEASEVK